MNAILAAEISVGAEPSVLADGEIIKLPDAPVAFLAYKVIWTEYESGWGCRPDGVSYSFSKKYLADHIKTLEAIGSYGCFSRASDITPCRAGVTLMSLIQHSKSGIYTTNSHNHDNDLGSL